MSEPTLTICWQRLIAEVGSFLGYGYGGNFGDPPYDQRTLFELNGIVASGLRKFYYPEPQEGSSASYDWSFLKITATLALAEGVSTVPLPDDYGGVDGPVTVVTTTNASQPWRIEWRNLGNIQQMFQSLPTMTGPPQYISEQPIKGTNVRQGQKFQFTVFPTADQDYTLQLNYYVNPDYLTTDLPFAYGGSAHSETILEACLSVAESRKDDSFSVHKAEFAARLAASIAMDRKNKPQKLGLNRDRSDERGDCNYNPHWYAGNGTYNGMTLG